MGDMGRCITEYECLGTAAMYMRAEDLIDPPYTQGAFMAFGYKFEKINPLFATDNYDSEKENGAIAMFYPGVLEKLAEICGGSYYVSFTSIHDVRIHPCINSAAETDSSLFKRCK